MSGRLTLVAETEEREFYAHRASATWKADLAPLGTDEDKAYFRSLIDDLPGAEVKSMFGNLAAFVNGNMFCGLFGSGVGVRLDEAARSELLSVAGAGAFGPVDRPMKEYVTMPAKWRIDGDPETEVWVHRALEHTANMPPKQPKKKPKKS